MDSFYIFEGLAAEYNGVDGIHTCCVAIQLSISSSVLKHEVF
jgi:hypothetical protein